MPLASLCLYTCVLQSTRREGWAGGEDKKKCMPSPVFLCHANRRAGINTGSVLTAHWVLVYYILKSKAQHSSNPSAHCNPQRAVPRSGILSAQERKKSSGHHPLYQGLNTSPGNPPPRPKLTVQSQHCSWDLKGYICITAGSQGKRRTLAFL